MTDGELPDGLRDELRGAWHRYLDLVAPLRPALHAYCRRLTGDVWDAEDLVQDTLLRAFGKLGMVHEPIANPRGYLVRTATNLWIDALRRRDTETAAVAAETRETASAIPAGDVGDVRDAGATLLGRLAPQERAAIVLKDVFDLTLDEIAAMLGTTIGAVKAALHRGRDRLHDPAAPRRRVPSAALVDRFVAAFAARDLAALTGLMLDHGVVENVGSAVHAGRAAFARKDGFFDHMIHGHPEWPARFQYEAARLERAEILGEPVALGFAIRRGAEALEQVLRFEEDDGRIARLRGYAFCPETMREIGTVLGLRVRTGLYRFPTPAPGDYWK